jgi:predicted acylesterase/phospholipase RssA
VATKPKIAYVFAGGGSLGAVQVGMLKALQAAGIRPDLLAGVSVGSINAYCYACDPTAAGVAVLEPSGAATVARIQLQRGREILEADWQARAAGPG